MKPDWKDAPEWAQWLAMDEDGKWYWYRGKPHLAAFQWGYDQDDDYLLACEDDSYWKSTLEERRQ